MVMQSCIFLKLDNNYSPAPFLCIAVWCLLTHLTSRKCIQSVAEIKLLEGQRVCAFQIFPVLHTVKLYKTLIRKLIESS
jgi:hypothetical protein